MWKLVRIAPYKTAFDGPVKGEMMKNVVLRTRSSVDRSRVHRSAKTHIA